LVSSECTSTTCAGAEKRSPVKERSGGYPVAHSDTNKQGLRHARRQHVYQPVGRVLCKRWCLAAGFRHCTVAGDAIALTLRVPTVILKPGTANLTHQYRNSLIRLLPCAIVAGGGSSDIRTNI